MTCLYHIRFRIQSYYLISLISYFGCWLVSNLSEVDLIQLLLDTQQLVVVEITNLVLREL